MIRIAILLCWSLVALSLSGQVAINSEKSLGILYAQPFIHEQLPEQRAYRPHMLLGYYTITDWLKKRPNTHLFVYLEPQLVLVTFSNDTANEIEFGANLGLQFQQQLFSNNYFTAAIGSGPHFITVETNLQANGYIFSDNMELGFRHKLKNTAWDIHAKWRFRHISNANFFKPNGGIDSWFLILGIAKRLEPTTKVK